MKLRNYNVILLLLIGSTAFGQQIDHWPEISESQKVWTRWWWMGSAVDSAGIRHNLISLSKAGIGGVEITPIYGVKGEEENTVEYLSPQWMALLDFTVRTADSLGMGVDMSLGTGWPYGGPQVEQQYAAKKIVSHKIVVQKKEVIEQKVGDSIIKGNPMKFLGVYAYGSDDTFVDLHDHIKKGKLLWKAKKDDYTVYFVYQGLTGQQVKRAAPGGKGYTLDHYSKEAFEDYTQPFNQAFLKDQSKLRAVFNDSYEVYGTDFTPNFFTSFQQKKGYDVRPYLNRLFEKRDDAVSNRIRSDYRETISELLLEEFVRPWTQWAHQKGFLSRLQAHGSPGNLIDLYAAADIPECETFGSMPYDIPGFRRLTENIRPGDADPAMLKFAASAAHISGKPLVSSETFTWLREHFKTALSQCKPEVEDLLLSGINHTVLHGSTYSPQRASWPGWKFYASVNFNENNSIWEDASGLFSYISRCQSFLQKGVADNETLLYFPIHDLWDRYLDGTLFFQFKIHSLDQWLLDTPFYKTHKKLTENGFGSDYISDDFVGQIAFNHGELQLPGGRYKALVVPDCSIIPLATLEKLLDLKSQGANIVFLGVPDAVPGFNKYAERISKLEELNQKVVQTEDLLGELMNVGVKNEALVKEGLKYIRREINGEKIYYIVNHGDQTISEIPLNILTSQITVFNPLNGEVGKAKIKSNNGKTMVQLVMEPGTAFILQSGELKNVSDLVYTTAIGQPMEITSDWNLSYLKGGPELPSSTTLSELVSWTSLSDPKAKAFSGTAVYETQFMLDQSAAEYWKVELGDLRESAKVWINGQYAGMVWALPFELKTNLFKNGMNSLKIQVTNLSANRIKHLEESGKEWKIFHEINMVDKDYKKFDATKWDYTPSGLLGPVRLIPLEKHNPL
ncbi:glycosyl hydrolase [Galbibacter sp.]|uniref:glycosyl hydrolase n=1 Tax=Galbibacter sp. TaxID=2918471 RepID=UPI003A9247F9